MPEEPPLQLRTVTVPAGDYRMSRADAVLWDATGRLITAGCDGISATMAFSIILSRTTRELRRHVGTESARKALQAFVDTMAVAADGDRETDDPDSE